MQERRIKQHIKAPSHCFRVNAHIGFENTLAKELAMLGIAECEVEKGYVLLKAKLEKVWQTITLSRCARSFEMKVAEFYCENFGKLEKKIKSVPWELYLPQNTKLKIDVKSEKSRLYHKGAIEERIKNNINFGGKLNVKFNDDICSVWLDLCGEPLHKRGERWVEDAPMQETLAASILLQASFAKYEKLIDPMAGSGVFSLEAAKWRSNSAITLNRAFDFAKMPAFREAAFNNFLQKAKQPFALKEGEKFEILCSDKSEKAVKTIKHNALSLPIQIKKEDFFSLPPSKNALLLLNPPYGKRLDREKNLYKEIAKKIEKDFKECALAIVCPANEVMNFANKIYSYNGGVRIAVCLQA
ncbi:MAG: hypothetical protein FWC26_02530 [Fibromonadales bacterium]|nr:hypothetical protein [Fibromonadales bacterium]